MMRRTLAVVATTTCVALVGLLVGAGVAVAAGGQFTLATCQADGEHYSSDAFTGPYWTTGMKVKPLCNPTGGKGKRGLITTSVARPAPAAHDAAAVAYIYAPPGTVFTSFSWAGEMRRRDCRWGVELYADLPDQRKQSIRGLHANRGCNQMFLASGTPIFKRDAAGEFERLSLLDKPKPLPPGAWRIVQRVICGAPVGQEGCNMKRESYVDLFQAEVTVADVQAPTATINQDTPLTTGSWVNGNQALNYDAQDNVGVRTAKVIGGGLDAGSDNRQCYTAPGKDRFTLPAPCPNGPGHITVDTSQLLEGTQPLTVQAYDAAGNAGSSDPVAVAIDRTAPARVGLSVDGGEQWRNRNDFALSWVNPPETDRAPIAAATYKLCAAAGGGSCSQPDVVKDGITGLPLQVPAPGEWTASVWLRDAAGNTDEKTASDPVTLRYDPDPPELGFEQAPADDPTTVSVHVTDPVSGLADGSIEISPTGSNTWQTLDTHKEASRLTARIDDAALPAGTYSLRATAHDQARNEASTTARLDGQPMTVTLPLRIPSTMQLGVPGTRTVRRVIHVHGKRRTVAHRESVLRPATGVVFGSNVQITGRLTNRDGQGIAGVDVQVLSRSEASAEQLVGVVHTDAAGNYAYTATGSASRVLRFAYAGSQLILPTQGEVRLRVPAATTLHVSRTHVVNGQSVTFDGGLRTLPVPTGGKLVELQVLLSGHWQTFRTGRTDQAGRWRLGYRFARTHTVQRFRFRVRLPHEAGYPYEDGGSRAVAVQVRGR